MERCSFSYINLLFASEEWSRIYSAMNKLRFLRAGCEGTGRSVEGWHPGQLGLEPVGSKCLRTEQAGDKPRVCPNTDGNLGHKATWIAQELGLGL